MSTNLIPVNEVQTMAIAVAKSGLFGMKTPDQALALMLVAQSEGLHPARAALEYHIIQGRPSLKADAMLSRFQNAGGKVAWKSYTDEDVTGEFSHPSGGVVQIQWTIKMAEKAGLTKNQTWRQYPRAMLRARCISEGIRTVYPGVSVGIYTPEEVQDFEPTEKDITPPVTVPMPAKIKEAVKPRSIVDGVSKVIPATAEHAKGTISGDPFEGDLYGIGDDRPCSDETKGLVINAFAKIGFNLLALEKEYGKPSDQWMESDVPELRAVLKSMQIEQKRIKEEVAERRDNLASSSSVEI